MILDALFVAGFYLTLSASLVLTLRFAARINA